MNFSFYLLRNQDLAAGKLNPVNRGIVELIIYFDIYTYIKKNYKALPTKLKQVAWSLPKIQGHIIISLSSKMLLVYCTMNRLCMVMSKDALFHQRFLQRSYLNTKIMK